MMPMMPMMPMMQGFPALSMGGGSYSSSSVSYSSGSGNAVQYSRTSSTKIGPGGLVEKQETERDSSKGVEKISLHRQLGDRARTVVRERDNHQGGQEVRHETLKGVSPEDATRFDQEWMQTAAQHLHPYSSSHGSSSTPIRTSQRLAGPEHTSTTHTRPANNTRHSPYTYTAPPRANTYTHTNTSNGVHHTNASNSVNHTNMPSNHQNNGPSYNRSHTDHHTSTRQYPSNNSSNGSERFYR